MLKPDAPKTVMNRARPGSGGSVALTLVALGVLGIAISQLGPASEIRAAEPKFVSGIGIEAAQAQHFPEDAIQTEIVQTAQAEGADWKAAFGHAPPPHKPPAEEPSMAPETELPATSTPVEPVIAVARDRSNDYWLTGHIIAGPDSVAMVHDGGEEQVVRPGSVLSGGEIVTDISAAGVVAEYDGQSFLIVLRDIVQPIRPARLVAPTSGVEAASRNQQAASRSQPPSRRSFIQQARARESLPAQGVGARDEDDDWEDDWDDDEWEDDDWEDDDDLD